jgi:hypothetical protein
VPLGPADIGEPPPQQWYAALYSHDCTYLEDVSRPDGDSVRALYFAIAEACLGKWPDAESAYAPIADQTFDGCLDVAAHRLLVDLLAAHRADPQQDPELIEPPPGTACPPSQSTTTVVGS